LLGRGEIKNRKGKRIAYDGLTDRGEILEKDISVWGGGEKGKRDGKVSIPRKKEQ
jgi:hypothetical protein